MSAVDHDRNPAGVSGPTPLSRPAPPRTSGRTRELTDRRRIALSDATGGERHASRLSPARRDAPARAIAAADMIRNILTTPRPGGMPANGGGMTIGSGIAGVASYRRRGRRQGLQRPHPVPGMGIHLRPAKQKQIPNPNVPGRRRNSRRPHESVPPRPRPRERLIPFSPMGSPAPLPGAERESARQKLLVDPAHRVRAACSRVKCSASAVPHCSPPSRR